MATDVNHDPDPPITTKTYGEPNTLGTFEIQTCDGKVLVNVHFITTNTTITLDAIDPEGENPSGVANTFYTVLVPVGCDQGQIVEYVGLQDHNIYENSEACSLAVDNRETEELETQRCVPTFWQFKEELIGPLQETFEGFIIYTDTFVIPQESVHKICFFSQDNHGNSEEIKCQVAVVDDNPPEIHSAEVDHHIIDLEYYSGGYNDNYFDDPKCAIVTVNATDTHEIDEVQVGVQDTLLSMFYPQVTTLPSFDQSSWEDYLNDEMHSKPVATFDEGTGNYIYAFCSGQHIYHLYDMGVISWDDLAKLVSEGLVLGEVELPIWVNDTTGKEAHSSVRLAVVDLTVPLEVGWNLRSTPIRLEGNEFWPSHSIDAVLRWDSEVQAWQLVTDNSMEPLDALYIHATDRNQIGIIFERDLTSPPVRQLHTGWNLAGMALPLFDSLQSVSCSESNQVFGYHNLNHYNYYGDLFGQPWYYYYGWHEGAHTNYYGQVTCNELTYLYDDYGSCIGEEALAPVVFGPDGNIALEVVISQNQYLDYSTDWGQWYFQQDPWVWIPEIDRGGFEIENDCEEYVSNFEGYWLFMQSPDLLPGQTTTPLSLYT